MAITFRGTKGSALTHDELDGNFREFFYSASVEGSSVLFHKYTAISSSLSFPIDPPSGKDGFIQLKSGNAISGANAVHTGSANFLFDYTNNIFKVTGSTLTVGDTSTTGTVSVTGSSNITGDLVVGGTVTAEEFITERVATSYVYKSGSTKFGDSSDDNHAFTGSLELTGRLEVVGPTTQSGDVVLTGNTVTNGDYSITGDITQSGNFDITGNTLHTGTTSTVGVTNLSGTNTISGSNTLVGATSIGSIDSGETNLYGSIEYNSGTTIFQSPNSVRFNTRPDFKSGLDVTGSTDILGEVNISGTTTISGSLSVTGRVTAQEFHTELVSSSIVYESGSTKFGDSIDDTHQFTGSVLIAGDTLIDGVLGITGFPDVSASLAGATSGSGLSNVVEDNSPQLGGNLDLNSNNVSGSGNINTTGGITITGNLTATEITGSTLTTSGAITAGGDVTAFFSSDERLKDNVTPIEGALEKVNQIGGYGFDWNSNSEHSGHDVGVIAQEIEKVLPEVVTTRDNGYKAVRYEKIVALLIQAVKEQQSQIEELKSKL